MVILHEYSRLWLYRLEWEGVSARYSHFTNAETIFHEGTDERGDYSVSNVKGRPEVEAFVTKDGGVLSPPGAGTLFSHTGGEFEDPLVSKFQNAAAFVGGLERGLEGANFEGLAERLRRMAALNALFPAPFAIGAVHGLASELVELVQWLNPQQWKAVEAAARQTILMMNDPDGEEVAATLGEEFGRTQAAVLDTLLQKSLPVFAYEVGKLVGPTIIETVLAFIGIEIGPLTVIQKTLAAAKAMPRLAGVLRGASFAFPDIPDRPGFPRKVEGEGAAGKSVVTEGAPDRDLLPTAPIRNARPDLSPQEQEFLARTGNQAEFSGALPQDLADQELAIVKRADKVPITESGGKYVNEVDLGNGHKWKEHPNGTWCRFSDRPTNCTPPINGFGPQPPGTIVASAADRETLLEVYTAWATNRAAENVEVALIKCIKGSGEYAEGSYAVVVGSAKGVVHPNTPGARWITISHVHPGTPGQPGYRYPSAADLFAAELDTVHMGKITGGIKKWVHFQTPDGTWASVKYGFDVTHEKYYVETSDGETQYFKKLSDPRVSESDLKLYDDLEDKGSHKERIALMKEQNSEDYYLGWYARQFVFDE
ncbi:MAG: hypothetical protein HY348_16075 [Nitrospira defluvii]|nr:hypothetical protein [Nitrospira defluvii]